MQDELKDCGAACLLTLIKTYGGSVSMEYLRLITNTSNNGTNFSYLMDAAEIIGFNSKAIKGDIENLNKRFLPCIAHVVIDNKYKHFVVIHNFTKKFVLVADPSLGLNKMKIDDFKKISTNQYLILIPNKKIPNLKNDNSILNYIVNFVSNYKKYFISIIIYSFVYTLLNIISSYGFQFIIEDSIEKNSINNLYFISLFLIIFALMKNIIDYIRTSIHNYIMNKFDYVITTETFKHIISLPYQYFKNKSTSDVFSRMNEINNIKESLSNIFIYVFSDSILVLFVFISLFFINIYLSLVSILIIFIYLFVIFIFDNYLENSYYKIQKDVSNVNLKLIESFESVEMIKGLKIEKEINNNFFDTYENYLSKSYSFIHTFSFESFIKNIINDIGIFVIMFLGSVLVINNKMRLNELITFNSLIIYFLEPIKNIIDSNIQIKKLKISFRRINDLYQIESEKLELDVKYVGKKIIGDINIENLCYSYNGRDNILKNINLNISNGEKILIYGMSGSGKSTLVKILNKYYRQDNGKITINSKDLDDYNLSEVRRDICYISQNEKILTDSVYNNIVLDRNIDYDVFLNVCKITQIDKIVNKNLSKYNMYLEENGFNISGGERQKIIIARSLIKDSNIFIFDESLSQVDVVNERIILEKIFKFLKGKTVIFISHRFDNNDLFDRKFLIEKGEIFEQ